MLFVYKNIFNKRDFSVKEIQLTAHTVKCLSAVVRMTNGHLWIEKVQPVIETETRCGGKFLTVSK